MFEKFNVPKDLIPTDPRFACGPSLIPQQHVENLLKTGQSLLGTSHRKPAIKNLVKEIQEGITIHKVHSVDEALHIALESHPHNLQEHKTSENLSKSPVTSEIVSSAKVQ